VWDPAVVLEDDETPWWRVESLKIVILQHNRISRIPTAFCCLAELHVLNLRSNQVTQLPEDISGLVELRSLIVSKNRSASRHEPLTRATVLVVPPCHGANCHRTACSVLCRLPCSPGHAHAPAQCPSCDTHHSAYTPSAA